MEQSRIENVLVEALLGDGQMAYALYEYDLEEYLDDWYASMAQDKNDFLFAVNENSGDVAMVLITPEQHLYINEQARDKLKEFWGNAYVSNMEYLIPIMARELANDNIAVNGVSFISE